MARDKACHGKDGFQKGIRLNRRMPFLSVLCNSGIPGFSGLRFRRLPYRREAFEHGLEFPNPVQRVGLAEVKRDTRAGIDFQHDAGIVFSESILLPFCEESN